MFKPIRERLYLLGYIIIMYGISQFGYICFSFAHTILNNKERVVIESNSITTIGKMHFNYVNVFLVIVYSIAVILVGVFIIKKGNKNKINNTI